MAQQADESFDSDPRIARILDIFAKETRADRDLLRPDASLADLGVESIDLTMAVFEIESAFGVDIPVIADRAGAEFSTVGDLVGHVIAVLDRAHAVPPETKASGATG
jgi:acyl carrier protein